MLRVSQEPAWILHRRPFRDTSVLLDVLTPSHGRVGLVARGGRKARSAGLLQPLQPLRIDFLRKTDLGTLSAYEPAGQALGLHGLALWSGFYLNELMLRLVPSEDEHAAAIFELYAQSLNRLVSRGPALVLRRFEYDFLALLGYGLDHAALAAAKDGLMNWDALRGLHASAGGAPREALLALTSGCEDERILPSQPVLAAMLQHLLGDRPLSTAGMLRDLVGLRQRARAAAGFASNQ